MVRGAVEGAVVSSATWKVRDMKTTDFINHHVKFADNYTPEQRASLEHAIREAGQSPVGQRMFGHYRREGETLRLSPEQNSMSSGAGPHVMPGTNVMYFNGEFDKSPAKKYLPLATDGVVFTHELGHTRSGYNVPDPLNVGVVENRFRGWNGFPRRSSYDVPYDVPVLPISRAVLTW
jgi:hypothetical protein